MFGLWLCAFGSRTVCIWDVQQRPVFLFAGLVVELWLVSVDGDGEFVDGFG